MTTTSHRILKQLVSFDSTSRNSNLPLIEWVAGYLRERGARVELIYNEARTKANVMGSLGPDRAGGIVMSGHTDVVPVDGQEWTSDPFTLTERDGRLYGRGSSDMKGFIACALAAADHWRNLPLRRPLHFAFSYDEEVGCLGAHSLVERIARSLPKPALTIVGEPTDMRVGVAHNGVTGRYTRFKGVAAHASDPSLGVNAIDAAAAFINFLGEVSRLPQVATHGCTLNVGCISGGAAPNIVAERCGVRWEYRTSTDEDVAFIRNAIEGHLGGPRYTDLEVASETELDVPQFSSRLNEQGMALLTGFGARMPVTTLPFGSEAGIFERWDIPTVVCGPGSINQAHRPDEWISRAALDEADQFMQKVGAWAVQAQTD
jgi:acetylornithine deacetylase